MLEKHHQKKSSCSCCHQRATTTALSYPMAVGLNKVMKHIGGTTGTIGVRLTRHIVWGCTPYEQCAQELLRMSKDKPVLKFIRERMGTHIPAKRKARGTKQRVGSYEEVAAIPSSIKIYAGWGLGGGNHRTGL